MPIHQSPDVSDSSGYTLEDLYEVLAEARQALSQATLQLAATQGVRIGERVHGAWDQNDPEISVLKQIVDDAQQHYRVLCHQLIPAEEQRQEAIAQQQLVLKQEQWVRDTHPELVATMEKHAATMQEQPHDSRAAYIARHEFQQLRFKLNQLWNAHQREKV